MNPKERITNLIALGQLEEAIRAFIEELPEKHQHRSTLTNISQQWFSLKDKILNGLLPHAEATIEKNNITFRLHELLKMWSEKDAASSLDTAIAELGIFPDLPLGVLQLVNCDRRRPTRKFRRVFDRQKDDDRRFQYYFLYGCPNEMPNSLAERVVYQVMDEEGEDINSAVHYTFREGTFKRIRIEQLPVGSSVKASQKRFKEYVQKRFNFANTESFEDFINTGVPRLPYSYVIAAFDVPEKEWRDDEGELEEYFQWMVDTFRTAHENVPTFLFFFTIKMRGVHDESLQNDLQKRILNELEAFSEKNDTAIIGGINPVSGTDFEDWLDELGVDNPNQARAVLEAMESEVLKGEERKAYQESQKLNMKDVEPIQKKIVLHFREKEE